MDKTGVVTAERGLAIQVGSGGYFHFEDPRPEEVHLSDIAAALSKITRYTGHTTEFYSVAQHSVLVSKLVPRHLALAGLLHDATEAYIGDINRPLKMLLDEKAPGVLRFIENRIHDAVSLRFNLFVTPEDHVALKHADNVALATEKRDLLYGDTEWPGMPDPMDQEIVPLAPHQAETQFLRRFRYIQREMRA